MKRNRVLFGSLSLQILTVGAFQVGTKCRAVCPRPSRVALNLEPGIVVGAAAVVGGGVLWLSGSESRQRQVQYAEYEAKEKEMLEERRRLAFIEPKETWTEEELAPYNGSNPTGPLLIAADGIVFNVWKGRHFYSPGCEYHVMAGRDATRFLASNSLEEVTEEKARKPLTLAEKASLEAWLFTFRNKYDIVGSLEGYEK